MTTTTSSAAPAPAVDRSADCVCGPGYVCDRHETKPLCGRCGHADVIGPFIMDGRCDGVYRDDYVWIVCRSCNGSTMVGQRPLP